MLFAGVLSACGGGSDDGGAAWPVAVPGVHRVSVPVKADSLHLEIVDQPDLDLPDVAVAGGGAFAARVDAKWEGHLFLLRLRQKEDSPAVSSDAAGEMQGASVQFELSEGHPGLTLAQLLVTGAQINSGSLSFNPLSDYISRRLSAYSMRLPAPRLQHFQNAMSAELISQDLTGDGTVDFRDVLVFDPQNAMHVGALSFDYVDVVNRVNGSGRSLLQSYAQAPREVDDALEAAFDPMEAVALPSLQEALSAVSLLHLDTDYGGSVHIDELPEIVLNAENPSLLQRLFRSEGPSALTLRATPDEGMRFVRWVGCPVPQGDGSCYVPGDQDQTVGAQFGLLEDELAEDVRGVVKLPAFARSEYDTALNESGTLTVYSLRSNGLLEAQLQQLSPGWMVATGNWRYPFRRVTQVLQPLVSANGLMQMQVQTEPAEIFDVYQAVSDFEANEQPTLDDVEHVRVSLDDSGEPALALLPPLEVPEEIPPALPTQEPASPLMRSLLAPASSTRQQERAWIPGYGQALNAGNGFYMVNNPDAPGFLLVRAEGSVQTLQGTPAQAAMRAYCAVTPEGPDCARLQRNSFARAALSSAASSSFTFPLGEVTIGKGNDPVLVAKFKATATLEFESLAGSMTLMWKALPPAADFRANARGNIKVTLNVNAFAGIQGSVDFAKSLNTRACGNGKDMAVNKPTGQPQTMAERAGEDGGSLLPGIDDMEMPDLDIQLVNFCNPDVSPSGSAGTLDVLNRNKLRIAVQLNPAWMGGAVAPLRFGVGVAATAKGQAGLTADLKVRQVFPYQVDVDIGSRCTKKGSKTSCDSLLHLKKPQRIEGHFGNYRNASLKMGLTMNAEFAPGLDASFTWGPRGVNEELLRAGATASLPLSVVGTLGQLTFSNFPEDVAEPVPGYCGRVASYAMGLGWKLELYAKLNPKISIGKFVKFGLKEVPLADWTKRGDILPPRLFAGKRSLITDDDLQACLPLDKRPAKFFAPTQTWQPAQLRWDQPMLAMTRKSKLVLQEDGNLVLYRLTRKDGGAGAIERQEAVWASQTYGWPGSRAEFNRNGQLIVRSLSERPVPGGMADSPAGGTLGRLEMREDGSLAIVNARGEAVWKVGP